MNFNHYKLHKHSHEQMQKYLQEAEWTRMIELAFSTDEKLHWVSRFLKRMKRWMLEMMHSQDRPGTNAIGRTGSYLKSSST